MTCSRTPEIDRALDASADFPGFRCTAHWLDAERYASARRWPAPCDCDVGTGRLADAVSCRRAELPERESRAAGSCGVRMAPAFSYFSARVPTIDAEDLLALLLEQLLPGRRRSSSRCRRRWAPACR